MATLYLRTANITADTELHDLPQIEILTCDDDRIFMKENFEPLERKEGEPIILDLINTGGFLTLSEKEALKLSQQITGLLLLRNHEANRNIQNHTNGNAKQK